MAVSLDEKKKNYTLQKSEEAFAAAKVQLITIEHLACVVLDLIPGGVNSPARAFKSVGGQAYYNGFCQGIRMWDIDGNEYIDYVLAAFAETMKKGTSFGAPCTEACMGVLRLARSFTGKERIIKFEGCYHCHADPFLFKAGSGVATLGLPDSPGEIAGIILEPVVGNSGFIAPKPEFLNAIRKITKEDGALLIFDEVMTGFRLSYGGAQEYFGITPDLSTLGKVIGGGLLVGNIFISK
uniref:Glutamate-1-semialdehyde 2,1-aminomutase n=1 Tax=Fagus sylvatica TaxID=28930 RepID=A0A2N9GDL4_FAGSY